MLKTRDSLGRSSGSPSARPAPQVLVVDDDADILALVTTRLSRAGYRVLSARDGAEGLKLALEHVPDVIVLDVTMPLMDGYEVTEELRKLEQTRNLPVLLLTARAAERDVERGVAAGATDYLTKPFSPQELATRVAALVNAG